MPPTRGTVDDNADPAAFDAYQRAYAALGLPGESFTSNHWSIGVVDAAGRGIPGVTVGIVQPNGETASPIVTGADGRAWFRPPDGAPATGWAATVQYQGWSDQTPLLERDRRPDLRIAVEVAPTPTKLDVAFLVDATGSMEDELARLRDHFVDLSSAIAAMPSQPDVHYGLVLYRDVGDAFVTRSFAMTQDPTQFAGALAEARALGGGDTPEDLGAGLSAAVGGLAWRGADTHKVLFLITDAPPHVSGAGATAIGPSAQAAAERGIVIVPIVSDGIDASGEHTLRQLARETGGVVVFATAGADGRTPALVLPHTVQADPLSTLPLDEQITTVLADRLG